MQTSFQSLRIGIAAFLLPYMFIYNPTLLLEGDSLLTIILGITTATIGLLAFACFIQGHAVTHASLWQRLLFLTSAVLLVVLDPLTDAIGVVLFVGILFIQWPNRKSKTIISSEEKRASY